MAWLKAKTRIAPPVAAYAPVGEVVYAIGDVHGRDDLLATIIDRIEADATDAPGLKARIVALGDYIDRGPDSRRVIDRLIGLKHRYGDRLTLLRGNHEAAMLDFMHDTRVGVTWCEFGGRETMASYGVIAARGRKPEDWQAVQQALHDAVPEAHVQFLADLETYAVFGDYVFVHAGLKPHVPLAQQSEEDMLWIRDEFLRAPPWLSQVVVHGHSPSSEPVERPSRIGVDTGAYATGVLTAVRLEADQRSFLQTGV